ADINHGMQIDLLMQEQSCVDARREVEMLAEQTAAERAGDEQPVAGPGAAAEHGALGSGFAEQGYGDDEAAVPAIGVAAADGGAEGVGHVAEALVQFLGEGCAGAARQTGANDGGERS